jgi:hypothetical protein
MRIAILLPGQPRFTRDFTTFVSNLKGYDQADWFVYITNNNIPSVANFKWGVSVNSQWINFDPVWAREKIKSWLPTNNVIQSFEISDDFQLPIIPVKNLFEVDKPDNVQKMFYNIYKADCLRQQFEEVNNFSYDLVIRTRADLGLVSELNLRQLNIEPNQIIMPERGCFWHGHPLANDQFAIGNSHNMKIYSTLFTRIKEINDSGLHFHPESMVGHNLTQNGLSYSAGNFATSLRTLDIVE